jgi:hypothetical protein
MKLDAFIKQTLLSIGKGLTEANQFFGDPHPFHLASDTKRHIDFEVMLVVEANKSKDVGGGLKVWVAEFHGGAKKSNIDKHVHTIRFSVNASERAEFVRSKRKGR